VLALATAAALVFAPTLVSDQEGGIIPGVTRLRGDNLADAAGVGLIGLILCLSGVPVLRGAAFWTSLAGFGGLLVLARTRSAYMAFLVFLVIGWIRGQRLPVRKLVLPLAGLGFTVFAMDAATSIIDYVVRERESISTMSDRLPLWEYLTSVVMREAPLTGLGYYAASRVVATQYNANLGNAHSAFFEVLLGGGLLGAASYIVLCVSLLRVAARTIRVRAGEPRTVAAVGLLAVALLMGITSPDPLHAGPLGFAFWCMTAVLPRLWRDAARATHVAARSAPPFRTAPPLATPRTG